jgi:hypothetical protein
MLSDERSAAAFRIRRDHSPVVTFIVGHHVSIRHVASGRGVDQVGMLRIALDPVQVREVRQRGDIAPGAASVG